MADSEEMGTGPKSSKPEDGGSLFLRNTDVKYIHIGCQSPEDYTMANPRRENFKSDTFTMCLLAAVVKSVQLQARGAQRVPGI